MSEEIVKNNETTVKIENQTSNIKDKNSMLNSFKQEFLFNISNNSIYVNSLKENG